MNRKDSERFLTHLCAKVPKLQPRNLWVVSNCPLEPWRHTGGTSGADVFGIRVESGDSFCNCFSCGFHGKQSDLVMEMSLLNKKAPSGRPYKFKEAVEMVDRAETEFVLELDTPDIEEVLYGQDDTEALHPFPESWLATYPKWSDAPAARKYLATRSVGAETADALDLRFDPTQRRICVPVRDFSATLYGFHGRAIDHGVEPRYRMYTHDHRNNPLIWYGEHHIDLDRPLVVVEGFFDLAAVWPVYKNVATPLFASPNADKLRRMADAPEWITFYDHGTGGDQGRAKVSKLFKKTHIIHHVTPPKHRKDPGECTPEEIHETLSEVLAL